MFIADNAFAILTKLFGYNRENFQNDRKQRQIMEYEVADKRIEQASLWREDVRDTLEFPAAKMEVYVMVIALELGFCIMALCKGRAPPGAPAWLAACHTIATIGAIMYFLLGLWFGMHCFVSSVAYKVRILTQLVRLPVPAWESLEACRTYGSAFEKLPVRNMLRVPFARHGKPTACCNRMDRVEEAGNRNLSAELFADPWGLEPAANNHYAELAPNVNADTDKQRHVWLVREASKYFQTYDTFCRICMSAGTINMSHVFCYFCLSYVVTENAAPAAAWAGMCVFAFCALIMLRNDLDVTPFQYFTLAFVNLLCPALSSLVVYQSSKHNGHPGKWERLAPVALFLHGFWQLYYLHLFRVQETQNGSIVPSAFKKVLFTDIFGWARHSKSPPPLRRANTNATDGGMTASPSEACLDVDEQPQRSPAMDSFARGISPAELAGVGSIREPRSPTRSRGDSGSAPWVVQDETASFRPGTFVGAHTETEQEQEPDNHSGTDISGEKFGVGPWRHFSYISYMQILCWFVASANWTLNTFEGTKVGVVYRDLDEGFGGPVSELTGEEIKTNWQGDSLFQPHGLACNQGGGLFVTSGVAADGTSILMRAHLEAKSTSAARTVSFVSTSPCAELTQAGDVIEDLDMHGCRGEESCEVLLLPRQRQRLISCPLDSHRNVSSSMFLRRSWLDDRGGIPPEGSTDAASNSEDGETAPVSLLYPEDISAIGVVPCAFNVSEGAEISQSIADCVVVGTTARRVVQLAADAFQDDADKLDGANIAGTSLLQPSGVRKIDEVDDTVWEVDDRAPGTDPPAHSDQSRFSAASKTLSSAAAAGSGWAPRRMFSEDHGEALAPGAFANIGGRYLLALRRNGGMLQAFDLLLGGTVAGVWNLPEKKKVSKSFLQGNSHGTHDDHGSSLKWASICAGGGAIYALEAKQNPSLWRFELPEELMPPEGTGLEGLISELKR